MGDKKMKVAEDREVADIDPVSVIVTAESQILMTLGSFGLSEDITQWQRGIAPILDHQNIRGIVLDGVGRTGKMDGSVSRTNSL